MEFHAINMYHDGTSVKESVPTWVIYQSGTLSDHLLVDIAEIRAKNAQCIISDQYGGNKASFASALGKKATYVSRWFTKNPKHRRNISRVSARLIEKTAGKRHGWLDEKHEPPLSTLVSIAPKIQERMEDYVREADAISAEELALIQQYRGLSKPDRVRFRAVIDAFESAAYTDRDKVGSDD